MAVPQLARRSSLGASLFLFAVLTGNAQPAAAQDVFPEVEYMAGHTGAVNKAKGSLVIGESELKFTTKNGAVLFSIPLSGITEVGSQTDIRDPSLGKKILFGFLAGSRKQEFVQVTYETEQAAEGIVFKVKQGISPGVVAKLKFAVKKTQRKAPMGQVSSSNSGIPIQTQ
jgi:hypothetical protein